MLYVGNNTDNCNEMLELFITTIPIELELLKSEIANENWDKAYEITHRIKPSFEIMQIKNASSEFFKLNNNIHLKIDLDGVQELFNSMETHLYHAIKQIKEDIK